MTKGFPVEALQHDSIVVEAAPGKGGGDHGHQDDDRRLGAEQEHSADPIRSCRTMRGEWKCTNDRRTQ